MMFLHNTESIIIKTYPKFVSYLVCLIIFLTLLLSITASAEIELNTTLPLEDNLVILLDYSGSTSGFREYIQSHAIHSIQNVENDSNVSIVVYGGFIKSTELYRMDNPDNRSILEDFVRNITGKYGDAAYNNGDKGFEEAGEILYNSTGTKQILWISSGVISDGRNNATDRISKKIKELKDDNIKIQLYQVSTTHLNNPSKHLYRTFEYLSDETNTKAVILNPEEDIAFYRNETREASSINDTRETITVKSPDSQVIDDEYLNEFSNSVETKSVVAVMYYGQKDSSYWYRVNFYSYCIQTCVTVPFDIGERKFYDDKETLEDIFVSKNAIELVKSGNVNEFAYTFSLGSDYVCGYSGDKFKGESENLGGKVAPLIVQKSDQAVEILKGANIIKELDPFALIISGLVFTPCYFGSNKENEVFDKITVGTGYMKLLQNNYAYEGIFEDFQNYNMDTLKYIYDTKRDSFVQIHAIIQYASVPFNTLDNCLNKNDCSIAKTNMQILDEKYNLINNNYAQLSKLSNQNYENEAELAMNRFNQKTEESNAYMDNATYELNELNNQIPYQVPFIPISEIIEKIINFFSEPETNYTLSRLQRENADSLLNNARENHTMFKFNTAIHNSKDSIAQSIEGIRLANIEAEKSKQRHLKIFSYIGG